ncbi:MAG: DUF2783 domain-containing protein [Gammaproteobacteria bacterium]
MTPEEFERAYERLAAALDAAGEAGERLFLTRLALLLAARAPTLADFEAALAAARLDVTDLDADTRER